MSNSEETSAVEMSFCVIKDALGNQWSVTILHGGRFEEPMVRFKRAGVRGWVDYYLSTLLECQLDARSFSVAGPEIDESVYPMPNDFPRQLAIWVRDKLPATVGEFKVSWVKHDPNNFMGGRW